MSLRIITSLSLAALLSFALAFWAYRSGAGAMIALLVYSLGGSTLTIIFAAISVFFSGFDNPEPEGDDHENEKPASWAHAT